MIKFFLPLTAMLLFAYYGVAKNAFLEKEARAYNEELPKRIAEDIVLERLEYKSKVGFKYIYTIEDIESDDEIKIIAETLISQEEEILFDTCKTLPKFFKLGLIADKTPLVYSYQTVDGKPISNILLDLNNCSKFEDDK